LNVAQQKPRTFSAEFGIEGGNTYHICLRRKGQQTQNKGADHAA
jgi:hypothetical protein